MVRGRPRPKGEGGPFPPAELLAQELPNRHQQMGSAPSPHPHPPCFQSTLLHQTSKLPSLSILRSHLCFTLPPEAHLSFPSLINHFGLRTTPHLRRLSLRQKRQSAHKPTNQQTSTQQRTSKLPPQPQQSTSRDSTVSKPRPGPTGNPRSPPPSHRQLPRSYKSCVALDVH